MSIRKRRYLISVGPIDAVKKMLLQAILVELVSNYILCFESDLRLTPNAFRVIYKLKKKNILRVV